MSKRTLLRPEWKRDGENWILVLRRRRLGRVVPDQKYPGMWRPMRLDGRLGDMANLAWAKNSVLVAAERELEWEERQRSANDPSKCPEKRGVFEGSSSLVRQAEAAVTSAGEPIASVQEGGR